MYVIESTIFAISVCNFMRDIAGCCHCHFHTGYSLSSLCFVFRWLLKEEEEEEEKEAEEEEKRF